MSHPPLRREPEPLADPCPCTACRQLAEAIDADLRARLRVLEAAELVDYRHGLNRTTPKGGANPE